VDILPEDLEARSIECLLLTVTTNCNLRCTYCCVSQPWYTGQNLDISRLDHFISELSDYKVGLIQVNGHGETTMVEGWEKFCQKLLQQGFALCITSNFARLFTSDELQVLASMRFIIISIDTVNKELLRRIRRAVKLENILSNMKNIQNRAKAGGLRRRFLYGNACCPMLWPRILRTSSSLADPWVFANFPSVT
jgi:molybdenum cofactor biosynthesis enzyme MoaA